MQGGSFRNPRGRRSAIATVRRRTAGAASMGFILGLGMIHAVAQVDPEPRELVQFGYNQAFQGHAPFSGYAFYYRNQPGFLTSNATLRLAVAPVYLDSELAWREALGPRTHVALGLAGGGFAESYNEIRRGRYIEAESFQGHGGSVSLGVYHRLDPGWRVPLHGVVRVSGHYVDYDESDDTAPDFVVPSDHFEWRVRAGLRWGGREPVLFPRSALELSVWYEWEGRSEPGRYGFGGDRVMESQLHRWWARAWLAHTRRNGMQFSVGLTAGGSADADRLGAHRLGALLPMGAEFALSLPGYFYQELSAESFVLGNAAVLWPLDQRGRWHWTVMGASGWVDDLPGVPTAGRWHHGVGMGLVYQSAVWQVALGYGYGVRALRSGGYGAHSVGLLIQADLRRSRAALLGPESPFRSRALFRWLGGQ